MQRNKGKIRKFKTNTLVSKYLVKVKNCEQISTSFYSTTIRCVRKSERNTITVYRNEW